MFMEQHDHGGEVTHGHILRAIGNLEGTLQALNAAIVQLNVNHTDMVRRLNQAEQRIAQGLLLGAIMTICIPLMVTVLVPRVQFGAAPSGHTHTDER